MANPELTVLCWLWSQEGGRTTYTANHVNVWADMVRRNLSIPHRIACVTDTPAGIDPRTTIIRPPGEFEAVRIPTWRRDKPQCLRRVALFRPDAAAIFGERFACMDLDVVIGGSLDPLLGTSADFKIYRGTNPDRPYNGSLFLLTAGARPQVYERFTPEGAVEAGQRFVGSDQAWISHVLGVGEQTWGPEDGIHWYGSHWGLSDEARRLIFFPGSPKPWEVAGSRGDPWSTKFYRRDRQGRALILGYRETVWDEAEAAQRTGKFDAVIASPEAARHWPGKVLVEARTDREAERLAVILGYDEMVFCGRSEGVAA